MPVTIERLRAHAAARSLFSPTTLLDAIQRVGFVQADPIRAPARAQDLILRHRVRAYRAGDLERRYPSLPVEEDRFVNYGFLPRDTAAIMHPRELATLRIDREAPGLTESVLEFVREHGPTHPRQVEAHLGRRPVVNYWGGTSSATTRALDALHYRGDLRVTRRDKGVKVYEAAPGTLAHPNLSDDDRARALLHLLVNVYAPLPVSSLRGLVNLLGYGAPHLKRRAQALLPAVLRDELGGAVVEGVRYAWPAGETPDGDAPTVARFLAPFDPVVWDRRRFEHLWGWTYRFEAYTPPAKRRFGYYALPVLWRDRVVGWANVALAGGRARVDLGFPGERPRGAAFDRAVTAETARLERFLNLNDT